MQEIVCFEDVSFGYSKDQKIFDRVSFNLQKGSFHYLTGASGSGKSTLIKLLYLGLHPQQGRISIFGQNAKNIHRNLIPSYRRRMGIVFQDFLLFEHLTALDNIALPLRLRGENKLQARRKADDLLEWIGLEGLGHMHPQNLSGGQQQRLAIARAVISRPPLIIADEPTGNVDDENAVKLLQLFVEMNRSGTTIIFATHNRDLMAEFPYSTLNLDRGHIEQLSRFKDIFHA
ncbi:MAG: cell division ATP-binding protein FtsE [Janthinobacterium lividum]